MSTIDSHDTERRDFLYIATGSFAAVGPAATAWPLIHQMNPDASVKALASVEVNLAPIEEGQSITISWRGNPVVIRHRTAKEIEEAKAVALADLPDQSARNANDEGADAEDINRVVDGKEKYLVMLAVCTHLGCVPVGEASEFGGWFCPCHGSHYDTSGRIRKGPAPENLPVPPYSYASETLIKIG